MQFPAITLLTAGALALLFLLLSYRVIRQRLATGASLGDGAGTVPMGEERNASPLFVASRTQANFAEYVPISLVLLLLLELAGAPTWAVATLAGMLVAARVLHPFGMVRPAPNPFRAGGILLQWLMLAAGGVYALLLGAMTQ